MTSIRINNVEIRGVAACVPASCEKNVDYPFFSTEESRKFMDTTGVQMHRIAPADVCTSDMCYTAAKKLLDKLSWDSGSIDLLLFISSSVPLYTLKFGYSSFFGSSSCLYNVYVSPSAFSFGPK